MYQPWELDDAVRSMIRRGQILKVDDSGSQQLVDLVGLYADKPQKIFRPQSYGVTSNPPVGSGGIMLALGGRSDRLVYLDGGHEQYRPTNTPAGAAVLYDDKGNVVFVKGADGIVIEAKSGKITIRPPDGQNLYLGGSPDKGDQFAKVQTASGPALNVFARIS